MVPSVLPAICQETQHAKHPNLSATYAAACTLSQHTVTGMYSAPCLLQLTISTALLNKLASLVLVLISSRWRTQGTAFTAAAARPSSLAVPPAAVTARRRRSQVLMQATSKSSSSPK